MTKFILVGGYPRKASDGGRAFSQELVRGFKEPVKILDCLFARPRDIWAESFKQDQEFYTKNLPETKIELVMADPDIFLKQIAESDVIYVRGGDTRLLISV